MAFTGTILCADTSSNSALGNKWSSYNKSEGLRDVFQGKIHPRLPTRHCTVGGVVNFSQVLKFIYSFSPGNRHLRICCSYFNLEVKPVFSLRLLPRHKALFRPVRQHSVGIWKEIILNPFGITKMIGSRILLFYPVLFQRAGCSAPRSRRLWHWPSP